MKKYAGFESKMSGEFDVLDPGGYVCEIKNAEVLPTRSGGERLVLYIDITEGDRKGFYTAQYKSDTREDKKWRGVYNVFLPLDDGSEQDTWAKNRMNNLVGCIEDGNPGYHWDWDEKKLKGKKVALVFRKEEYQRQDGSYGWVVKPFKVISIGACRDGKWGKYEDKPVANKPKETVDPLDSLGDLPF